MSARVEPVVTSLGVGRYRIVGGRLREDWARSVAPGVEAWCEIRVVRSADGHRWICVYGGEVWPSAWPHLFAPTEGDPSHVITPAGLSALDAADAAVEPAGGSS